jgi:hypothetical protein
VQGVISNLTSWLEAAFAVNLAYPILVEFKKFTGRIIGDWADLEKVRVIPAMAETASFDPEAFIADIDGIEARCVSKVRWANWVVVPWAIASAGGLFVLLFFSGFKPEFAFSLPGDTWVFLLLSGAVPVGLSYIGGVHLYARVNMWKQSKVSDAVIKYSTKQTKEKVHQAAEALRAKLRETRQSNNLG